MINKFFDIFFGAYGNSVLLLNKDDFTIADFNKQAMLMYDIPLDQRDKLIGKSFTTFKLSEFSSLKKEELNTIILEIREKGIWSVVLPTKTINNVPFMAKTTISLLTFEKKEYILVNTEKISDNIQKKEEEGTTKILLAKESIRAKLAEEANILLEREIENHKATQREYIKAQEFVNSMINSSLDIILATDINNKITHVSPSATYLFGYSKEEFENINPSDLYKDPEEYYSVKNQIKKNGYFIGEIVNKKKNGKIFNTYLSASPINNKEGEVIGLMGVSRDIEEIKKIENEIIRSEKRYRELFENLSDAILIVDEKNKFIDINEAGKKLFEITDNKENVLSDFISKKHLKKVTELTKEIKKKGFVKGVELEIEINKNVKKIVEVSSSGVFDNKVFKGARYIIRDITEKKITEEKLINSLSEKEVLLKEVHHRVKNNLQVISSILNLQSSYVKDKNTLDILRESQNRIKSMSFIHESLYRSADFSYVNFSDYIATLASNLVQSYIFEHNNISLEMDLGEINLNLDQAIPCGLIINELVSNSIKYAFPNKNKGVIRIELTKQENKLQFIVSDNGIGLPEGFNVENTDTLGLQLVYTLISQLDGDIRVINKIGTKYLFNFTIQNKV